MGVEAMTSSCPFCEFEEPAIDCGDVLVFPPRLAARPGHVLVVPKMHVEDFGTDPGVSARVAYVASQVAHRMRPARVFTNLGAKAGQSVMHLHIHVVPEGPVLDQFDLVPFEEGEPETLLDPIEPLDPATVEKLREQGIEIPDWKPTMHDRRRFSRYLREDVAVVDGYPFTHHQNVTDYVRGLEERIKEQRGQLKELTRLRKVHGDKKARARIDHLERLLGKKDVKLSNQHDGLTALNHRIGELRAKLDRAAYLVENLAAQVPEFTGVLDPSGSTYSEDDHIRRKLYEEAQEWRTSLLGSTTG